MLSSCLPFLLDGNSLTTNYKNVFIEDGRDLWDGCGGLYFSIALNMGSSPDSSILFFVFNQMIMGGGVRSRVFWRDIEAGW